MTAGLINAKSSKQPWLSSPLFDLPFILAPALLTSLLSLYFVGDGSEELSLASWVILVLMVDVAHVYATLYRTYFDKEAFATNKTLLIAIPLLCFVLGVLLYSLGALFFWRAMAYLAVFHFVRQQYGFMALYARKELRSRLSVFADQAAIYAATLYPIIYWHAHLPRHFNWFVEGDFISLGIFGTIEPFCRLLYFSILLFYAFKEVRITLKNGFFNWPRNLLLVGTILSWWLGIVWSNSDLIFTMTNVVSHGIPYMALVWLFHHGRRSEEGGSFDFFKNFLLNFAPAFFLFLVLLAYVEEGFWDGLVWREHLAFFAPFRFDQLPAITDAAVLSVLVPLLSLPQSTHYVLDGFIWKLKDRDNRFSVY